MNHLTQCGLLLGALVVSGSRASGAPHPQAVLPEDLRGSVTLSLVDADIRDALRLVGRQAGVNMVISNRIEGTVTMDLDQVSLDDTLDALANVAGFRYGREGRIVTVSTVEELLEAGRREQEYQAALQQAETPERDPLVLHLRYVDAERIHTVIQGMLGEGGSASILQTTDHIAQQYSASSAAPSDEAALQIGTQLSTSTQGLPAKTHTLVVVDTPDRLQRIEAVVAKLDVKPVQVLIESRFVEISLDKTHKLGIDWNVAASGNGGSAPHTYPFGGSSLGEFNPNVAGGSQGGIFPDAPDSVTTPGSPGLFTFGTLDFTAFSSVLEMIQTDARVQVVSNPRIVVGDRHTATILVGERYPILSANISEFGTVTEELDRYEPIGVQLEVTPSVLGDDEVELFVRPSTSSLGPLVTGSTGLSVARINSRQIDTTITIRDRQTVVLGGLFSSRESETDSKVPLIGSIPLLGRLFSHKADSVEQVDLVVFLTVAIVQESGLTEKQRELFEGSGSKSGLFPLPEGQRSALGFAVSPPQH